MGAWGEGHQCNDTALDYIECNQEHLMRALRQKTLCPELTRKFIEGEPQGVLAMTEWLLDHGYNNFDAIRPIIDRAIKLERSDLDTWVEPPIRAKAINWLEDRLNGRLDIDNMPDEVKQANKGLLERIFGELDDV